MVTSNAGSEPDSQVDGTHHPGGLGLREAPKPPELAGRGGAGFAGRGVSVQMRERLTIAGVPVEDDDSGLPVARCYVRDPFGNRIELVDSSDAGFSSR